jgi:hypothetical protein
MRTIVVSLVLAACGCSPLGEELGPQHGTWRLDTSTNEGWYCANAGAPGCTAPTYFTPLPDTVEVGEGTLTWSNGVQHTGAIEPACIRVPAGGDQGVARSETTFCNLVDGMVVNETRAFAIIGWSPGSPNACTCSAHFDYVE